MSTIYNKEARLDVKFIEFAKQLNLYLNHFPKHEKFGLSQRIRNTAYEIYDYITESQKRYQKKTSLTNLDIRHEQLRMQIRLAFELGYFEFNNGILDDKQTSAAHRYIVINRMVDEIGKLIGGWINADNIKTNSK